MADMREQLKKEAIEVQEWAERFYMKIESPGLAHADLIARQDAYIDEILRINKLAQERIKQLCEAEFICENCEEIR